jgi:hypothetical protein
MSQDDILGRELAKLANAAGKSSEVEDSILSRELGKLGASYDGKADAAIELTAKFLPDNTGKVTSVIAAPAAEVLKKAYEILKQEGTLTDEPQSDPNVPTMCGIIGSGIMNMNPAIVKVYVAPFSATTTRVLITGSAKEGLIKQHGGEKAAQRIAALLTQAFRSYTPSSTHAASPVTASEARTADTLQPRPNRPTTILFLAADPSDVSRLRLGEEAREIREKLQLSKQRDQFELKERSSVRPADISQAMLDEQPQIVHFSGHGTKTGAICFENLSGEAQPVDADALAELFEQFADQLSCVVLNACYSATQASAIAQHINYVIGMSQEIGDKAAVAFAIGFYQALGGGQTIEKAYKLGCIQIKLQGIPENLTPVLIKKKQANP